MRDESGEQLTEQSGETYLIYRDFDQFSLALRGKKQRRALLTFIRVSMFFENKDEGKIKAQVNRSSAQLRREGQKAFPLDPPEPKNVLISESRWFDLTFVIIFRPITVAEFN